MQDESGNSLFDLTLTHEGLAMLQSNARLTRSLFILGMIAALLLLGIDVLGLFRFQQLNYKGHGLSGLYDTKLHPVISIIDVVLVIFQFYAYFRFGRISGKAIDGKDEAQLNGSFVYLVRFTRLAIIQICLLLVIYLFSALILIGSIISPAV